MVKKTASNAVLVVPTAPVYDPETWTITVPTVTGAMYKDADTGDTLVTGTPIVLDPGEEYTVQATPSSSGYYFETNENDSWTFSRPSA